MESLALMPKYEAYKDSGVEWLEQIPNDWLMSRLKFLVSIKTGEKDTAHRVDDGIYPFFIRSPKVQRIDSYSFDGEAILTAGDGDIGKIFHYINGKFDYHQRVYKFSDFRRVKGRYLYYYLQHNLAEEVVKLSAKTTVDSLRLPYLQNFVVTIPSRQEQRLIANFLDKKTTQIDEAIAIKEQQIKLLQERKQIIIQKAVTQGLDPNVPMKDSGVEWIGQIPEHWEMKRVKNIFRMVMEPSEINNNYELLSVYTDIGVKPRRELEERGNKASTTDGYWFVKKGDIVVNKLLAWMGAIGLSEYDGVTSPAYDILRPKVPVNGLFYHYLFRSDFCSAELKRHSRGIMDMRLRLYFDKFGVIEVPYPPIEEQHAITDKVKIIMSDIEIGTTHLKDQIQKLKEYKTTLINSAVTGKIKITPEMLQA